MGGLRALRWKPHLRITSISAKLVTSAATQITRRPACPIPSRVAASRDASLLRAPQPSLSGEPLGNDGGCPTRRLEAASMSVVLGTLTRDEKAHSGLLINSLSLLRGVPRANSSKSEGLDPSNVARSAAQRFWRKLYGWSKIYLGQVLKERHRATLRDSCLTIDHEIFLEAHSILARAEQGKRHTRVPPHILDLLPHPQVPTNKLVPVDADP